MSIKKQLGMGVATAALGLTLVGGGTWAAFNDTATINNHFAAGTLDLEVGKVNKAANFDLGNMKPGDEVKRVFTLNNKGTLAIKEVLLNTTAAGFKKGVGSNKNMDEFLSQFEINVFSVDSENTEGKFEPRKSLLQGSTSLTLADLVNNNYSGKIKPAYLAQDSTDTRINLAPLIADQEAKRGIPVTPSDSDSVMFVIKFKDDKTRVGGTADKYGEFVQNKFQGNSANFYFNLEATQWDGMELDSSHGNGEINNGVQGSADGLTYPNPRSIQNRNGEDLRKHKDNEVVEPANKN
ncbi:TasA family protein [Fictibacillus phosphorivorans]|uniref:TasA family protein n=1 Tax=Fictibacillus phosphorivorans TaxID=1221500 RepID=UPI0020422E15|nr:TasA family protein [Fictibacillus phosphorivorans]MCM3718507.1 CalY family protein [Fictibacillus phosphorivorans]MCM3776137.1 CalY family protein [Fictibacillus phosphorivorans]